MSTTVDAFLKTFIAARADSTPLVAVRTPDPASAIRTISYRIGATTERTGSTTPLTSWDIMRGLVGLNAEGKRAVTEVVTVGDGTALSLKPTDALEFAERFVEDTILFFIDACWRFASKFGIQRPTRYRTWSTRDQQKVLEMTETRTVKEIAKHFGVSSKAIYHAIARLLTVKPPRVRSWIDSGKLACTVEGHGKVKYTLISAADLVKFCKTHMDELLRQRIPEKRIPFLLNYVVSADVADDYQARSSKHERQAFERGEYLKRPGQQYEAEDLEDDDEESED